MGFSGIKHWICASCSCRWILYHWATREALQRAPNCCLIFHVVVWLPYLFVNLTAHLLSQRWLGKWPLLASVSSALNSKMGLIATYHIDSWEDIKRDHLLEWLASCLEHDRYTMNTEYCLDVTYLFQNQTMFLHNCQMCKHFLVTQGTWQGAGGEGWGWRDWGAGSILVTSSCPALRLLSNL